MPSPTERGYFAYARLALGLTKAECLTRYNVTSDILDIWEYNVVSPPDYVVTDLQLALSRCPDPAASACTP